MSEYMEFAAKMELKSGESEEPCLEGYFAKYNEPAPFTEGGHTMEQIKPGAFGEFGGRDIRCLYNHNTDFVLGRTSSGTLELESRSDGLYGRVKVNVRDSEAVNVYERVKRGDISGCSFGAYVDRETYDDERDTWTLENLTLVEVSVCPFPFYGATTMEARGRKLKEMQDIKKARALKASLIKRRLLCH